DADARAHPPHRIGHLPRLEVALSAGASAQDHHLRALRGEGADGIDPRAGPHELEFAVPELLLQPGAADQHQPGGGARGVGGRFGGGGHLFGPRSGSSASSISSSSLERIAARPSGSSSKRVSTSAGSIAAGAAGAAGSVGSPTSLKGTGTAP